MKYDHYTLKFILCEVSRCHPGHLSDASRKEHAHMDLND